MRRLALVLLAALAASPVAAQSWPQGRITLVVPYPAGGTADVPARLVAAQLNAATGQPVVVDNRPGVGGRLGSKMVADAKPDGLTLLAGNNGTHVIQPILGTNVQYDPVADFTPIVMTGASNVFVGVGPEVPARSLADFVAMLRKEPGKYTFGSSGIGSFGQFSGELLKLGTGTDMLHVPYRGSAAAVTDLVGGRITAMLDPIVLTQRDRGVRVLAVLSPERYAGEPDIPTAAEAGVPGLEVTGWFAIFGPKGMAPDVVARINRIVNEGMKSAEAAETLRRSGLSVVDKSPADLATRLASDLKLYREIKERAKMESVE